MKEQLKLFGGSKMWESLSLGFLSFNAPFFRGNTPAIIREVNTLNYSNWPSGLLRSSFLPSLLLLLQNILTTGQSTHGTRTYTPYQELVYIKHCKLVSSEKQYKRKMKIFLFVQNGSYPVIAIHRRKKKTTPYL